jgi:hypothetical protein
MATHPPTYTHMQREKDRQGRKPTKALRSPIKILQYYYFQNLVRTVAGESLYDKSPHKSSMY